MRATPISFLLLFLLGIGNGVAQTEGGSQEETLRKLIARVESLEAEVQQLRSEKAQRTAAPRRDAKEMASPPVTDSKSEEIIQAESFPQLKIRGFGDVDYHWSDLDGDKNSFALGQFDLFITSQLAENWNVLAETVIEADDENHFGIEIERLLLQYTPREYFNLAAGRYHTAIGYYNTAYHHGTWLQTAVGRPDIFEFEDDEGLLPIHNVGFSLTGAIPSGRLGLHYVAQIGNGRRYEPGVEPVQNVVDNNGSKAVNLGLYARPEWLPGLQFGASAYFDRLNENFLPTVDQTIVAGHVVYVTPAFEWLTEGVLMRDESDLGTFDSSSFYTQIAHQFGKFRPYVRYQFLDGDENDPIVQFADAPGYDQTLSLGVRYDFTNLAAFKVQWDHALTTPPANHPDNDLTLQLSFTF